MSQVSVDYINPFIQATSDALTMMAGVAVERSKITLKESDGATYDISGIIGLAGEVVGSVTLSFPHDVAIGIASKFLGEEIGVLDSTAQSAIGELTNMVAGGAKRELSSQGLSFKIGLPNVVIGKGHQLYRPKNAPTIVVHFNSDEGEFVVEVCLKRGDGSEL